MESLAAAASAFAPINNSPSGTMIQEQSQSDAFRIARSPIEQREQGFKPLMECDDDDHDDVDSVDDSDNSTLPEIDMPHAESHPPGQVPTGSLVEGMITAVRRDDVAEFAKKLERLWLNAHRPGDANEEMGEYHETKLAQFLKKTSAFIEAHQQRLQSPTDSYTSSNKLPRAIIPESVILCGAVINEKLVDRHYSEYFGKEVEVFTATNVKESPILYKASTLTTHIGCAPNQIAMHIARRKQAADGSFQASGYLKKPRGRCGLKKGSYFLSEDACREFESYFCRSTGKRRRRSDEAIGDIPHEALPMMIAGSAGILPKYASVIQPSTNVTSQFASVQHHAGSTSSPWTMPVKGSIPFMGMPQAHRPHFLSPNNGWPMMFQPNGALLIPTPVMYSSNMSNNGATTMPINQSSSSNMKTISTMASTTSAVEANQKVMSENDSSSNTQTMPESNADASN